VNWLGKKFSIRFDLSWLFPKPAPPPQSATIVPESSEVAQMNADLDAKIDSL
jgi:hypothetical protein